MAQPLQLVRFSLAYLLSFDHYNSSFGVSFCDTGNSFKCFNLNTLKRSIFPPVFVLVVLPFRTTTDEHTNNSKAGHTVLLVCPVVVVCMQELEIYGNSIGCFQPIQVVLDLFFNHIFTMLLFSCNIVKNNPYFNRFLRSQRKHFVLWFNTFRTPVKA